MTLNSYVCPTWNPNKQNPICGKFHARTQHRTAIKKSTRRRRRATGDAPPQTHPSPTQTRNLTYKLGQRVQPTTTFSGDAGRNKGIWRSRTRVKRFHYSHFLVSKFRKFNDPILPSLKFIFSIDIDLISKIFKMLLNGSSGVQRARLLQNLKNQIFFVKFFFFFKIFGNLKPHQSGRNMTFPMFYHIHIDLQYTLDNLFCGFS